MSWTQRLADLAVRIAPEARRDWARAIAAELAHLPATQRPGFALGGVLAAIGWRVRDPQSVDVAARGILAAGALIWAGLLGHLAWRLAGSDTGLATVFGAVGLIACAGAVVTARLGLNVVVRVGGAGFCVAAGYALLAPILTPDFPALGYCRAVSTEIAGMLALAIVVALLVRAYGRWSAA